MKTPMPKPEVRQARWRYNAWGEIIASEPDFTAYTESQLRAAMVAAYNEAIEDAATKVRSLIGNKNPLELVINGIAKEILTLKETP